MLYKVIGFDDDDDTSAPFNSLCTIPEASRLADYVENLLWGVLEPSVEMSDPGFIMDKLKERGVPVDHQWTTELERGCGAAITTVLLYLARRLKSFHFLTEGTVDSTMTTLMPRYLEYLSEAARSQSLGSYPNFEHLSHVRIRLILTHSSKISALFRLPNLECLELRC